MTERKRIALLAYRHCVGMEIFSLADLLLLANRVARATGTADEPMFDVDIVSVRGRTVTAAGGFSIGARRPRKDIDLLVVPGLDFHRRLLSARLAELAPETRFIRRTFARGTPVASVCVGAFLLGEAGLLDGRRVTTAWFFAREFAERYPRAQIQSDALLLEDSGVTTAGAFSAATDLAMHLIRAAGGEALASATARLVLLDSGRQSQAPFVDSRLLVPSDHRFSDQVQRWLAARFEKPYDLARLARAFHVSPRTLLRRFATETGMSPLAYLQGYRVQRAKELLQSSSLSVAQITEQVGYADVATFCSLFKRLVKLSPAEYRHRFAEHNAGTRRNRAGDNTGIRGVSMTI